MQLRNLFGAAALLSASFVSRAATVNFNFTFAGASNSGSGTFVTSTTATAGQYLVTSATGTINGSTISLLPVGAFPSAFPPVNDNLLFYPDGGGQSFVDESGIALVNAAGLYLVLFHDNVLGYEDAASLSPTGDPGTSELLTSGTITPTTVAATPEPGSFALLGTGVLSLAGMARRRFVRA